MGWPGAIAALLTLGTTVRVDVQVAVDAQGELGPAWLEAIEGRISKDALARHRRERRPLSPAELAWLARFRGNLPRWTANAPTLHVPFDDVVPPARVSLVLGNRGGDDGFTSGERTIGVDLGAWVSAYGDAAAPGSDDRIVRILSHEYTHLLSRAWAKTHRVFVETPVERALWTCFHEGLGNYRSLSEKWRTAEGALTTHARATLARLEPAFVERMAGLARAVTSADEERLLDGIDRGRFDQKWGALTVALWLAVEARGDHRNLRTWVKAGPAGILVLARRHLSPDRARRLPRVLVGQALDAKAGAVIETADAGVVYVAGLPSWPAALRQRRVAVTGIVVTRKLIPDPVVGPKGEISQGAQGDQTVIEGARWRLVE